MLFKVNILDIVVFYVVNGVMYNNKNVFSTVPKVQPVMRAAQQRPPMALGQRGDAGKIEELSAQVSYLI